MRNEGMACIDKQISKRVRENESHIKWTDPSQNGWQCLIRDIIDYPKEEVFTSIAWVGFFKLQ